MNKKNQIQLQLSLYILFLVLLSSFLISPFFIAILFAATVAFALYPFQLKLERQGWKKTRAAGLIVSLFTFVISIPFMFFVTKGTLLIIDVLERFALGKKIESQGTRHVFQVIRDDVVGKVLKYLEPFPAMNFLTQEKIYSYIQTGNVFLLDFFKSLTGSIPFGLLFFVIIILCTYSFLSGSQKIRNIFQSLFGFTDNRMDQLIVIFLKNSRQVYISNLVTGLIQSGIVATGVYFFSGAEWFLIFFVTLILSFVPVIGAAPMAFLFALVALIQGHSSNSIILFILGGVTGVIDNLLRPLLASYGESSTPASVSFIFVIGGALLFGFPGLFIGLFAGAIAHDTLPIFWKELVRNDIESAIKDPSILEDKSEEDVKDHLV